MSTADTTTIIKVAPADYVTVRLYATISGKSEGAIRKLIDRGHWVLGKQYRKDELGGIWINTKGVTKWVEGMA